MEEYEKCISCLKECILSTNDIDFVNRKKVLEDELIVVKEILDIVNTAVNLYDEKMYEEAFAMLMLGLEQYPKNERIETKLVDFHNHFIIYNTKLVVELCEGEKYKEALKILDEALLEYECEELLILKEKVKEEKNVLYKLKNDIVAKVEYLAQEIKNEEFDVKQLANDTGAYIIKSGEKLMLGE